MEWLNSITKSASGLTVGWVDFVTLLVICVGIIRGRKRGLSEELLDTIMWVTILITSGLFYRNVTEVLSQKPIFSRLTYYMMSFLGIGLGVKIVFVFIKRKFGQKVGESDVFGRLEFYGGMAAGVVRFSCIYLYVFSLLNAPYYSPEFLVKRAKDVDYNFGSDFFPHPSKIQTAVFKESFTGKSVKQYLGTLLIEPTEGSDKSIRDDNSLAKRNERKIDAIMGGR